MRSVAGERGRDRVLHRQRTAQTAVGQFGDRLHRVIQSRRSSDAHPARAPTRREVRLRQARERDDWRVRIEAADWRHASVVRQVSIHLVGDDGEPVPIGEVEERTPRRRGVRSSGRIIGIDDDERAGRRRHDAAKMTEIGHPPEAGIGPIEQCSRAELGEDRCIQRIRWQRHQNLGVFVD